MYFVVKYIGKIIATEVAYIMKKILCSVLCLMLALFMLVGCGEDAIGGYIDQYEKPTEKELLTYNLNPYGLQ